MTKRMLAAATLAMALGGGARAQEQAMRAKVPCEGAGHLSPDMIGWNRVGAARGALTAQQAAARMLPVGSATRLVLTPAARLKLAVDPSKAGAAGGSGGLVGFVADDEGDYRVSLADAAWIEVVGADGKPVASMHHSHGPDCTGIRKMVDFHLPAGRYILQLTGSEAPQTKVMVSRVPQ